ncbi:uncharacterized protein LOC112639226 [Camponotus floridanus]|uniref:uncharacterized protein LOC112639226 n=1 Tax=Camponotus floridanus TaxID=104421 RepID=UPI000DC6C99D|nr:uncharacterized protein LOC112639226 [Camponotus floridanus]
MIRSGYDTALNPFNNIDKTGWLINISNKNIPDRVFELLSLGDNFGLPLLQSHAKDRINVVLETLKNFEINYNRSPLYNVAQYIHDILKISILQPKSHIKDGWTFANLLKDKTIRDDEVMISLNVTALFTNIPKDLIVTAVTKRWSHIAPNTKLYLAQFLHAIETVLDSTSFSFNGNFYEQIFGSPMGSPLSPILADIVMDDLEMHCLSLLSFDVPIYYRYVDDIFTIVSRSKIEEIKSINNYHRRLTFTHETEVDSSISFLNTMVIRSNGRLLTDWYRKPTCSNRYINFHSKHPLKYKLNTIYNLVDHAILLADTRFHAKNIEAVRRTLSNNCFPNQIINRHVQKRLYFLKHRDKTNTDNESDNAATPSYISLPFVDGWSDDVDRFFKKIGFKVVYNVPKKLNSLIKRGKDRLPINNRTEVVYKLDCKNCNVSYIGQTKRHVSTRVKEHRNNIKVHETKITTSLRINYCADYRRYCGGTPFCDTEITGPAGPLGRDSRRRFGYSFCPIGTTPPSAAKSKIVTRRPTRHSRNTRR